MLLPEITAITAFFLTWSKVQKYRYSVAAENAQKSVHLRRGGSNIGVKRGTEKVKAETKQDWTMKQIFMARKNCEVAAVYHKSLTLLTELY